MSVILPRIRCTSAGGDASVDLSANWGSITARADLCRRGYFSTSNGIDRNAALQTISARSNQLQLAIARDTLVNQTNLQTPRWRLQAGLVSSLMLSSARCSRRKTAASIPSWRVIWQPLPRNLHLIAEPLAGFFP
jgi:hypothetical protein